MIEYILGFLLGGSVVGLLMSRKAMKDLDDLYDSFVEYSDRSDKLIRELIEKLRGEL